MDSIPETSAVTDNPSYQIHNPDMAPFFHDVGITCNEILFYDFGTAELLLQDKCSRHP